MAVKIPENYVSGGFTMEYEVPWMTPGAVRKLDELVHSDDRVIEVGTGGSSLFFARRCRAVLGAEPNLEWGESVVAEARSRGLGNIDIVIEPDPGKLLLYQTKATNPPGWGRSDPCLLYTSPSPRDATLSRMPSSA